MVKEALAADSQRYLASSLFLLSTQGAFDTKEANLSQLEVFNNGNVAASTQSLHESLGTARSEGAKVGVELGGRARENGDEEIRL